MSRFDTEFEKSKKQFNFIFNLILTMTILVFIGTGLFYVGAGYIAYSAVEAVSGADAVETAKHLGEIVKSFKDGAGQ